MNNSIDGMYETAAGGCLLFYGVLTLLMRIKAGGKNKKKD